MKPTTSSSSTRKRKRMAKPAVSTTATLIGCLCTVLSVLVWATVISSSIEMVDAFQIASPSTRAVLSSTSPSTTSSALYYSNDDSPKSKSYNTKNNLPSYLLPTISASSSMKDSSSSTSISKTPTIKQRFSLSSQATNMKQRLLEEITEFRRLVEEEKSLKQQQTEEDTPSSSSLSSSSSLPQMIDYYSISKRVGDQAKLIVDLCNDISEFNPNPTPTKFLADEMLGDFAPLNGSWKSLFTTASDADFSSTKRSRTSSKKSSSPPNTKEEGTQGPRSRPKVQNVVDASEGTITNVVDFPTSSTSSDEKRNRLAQLEQLNVVIKASPLSSTRVGLDFKYAKLIFRTQLQLVWNRHKLIQFKWPIFIPLPPTFIVRSIVSLNRLGFKLKQKWTKWRTRRNGDTDGKALDETKTNKEFLPPKPYFDILYLDDNLRIHKTGEDNYFAQAKDTWTAARPLIDQ